MRVAVKQNDYAIELFHKKKKKRKITEGRGYDGGDNAGGHAQSEGSAENTQKHSKRLEQRHDLKGVAVVSLWLVGYDRPEKESTPS